MEFNSEAVTAASFGVDAVAFERLEHTTRTKVRPILGRDKGGWWSGTFRPYSSLVGARRTAYYLIVWPLSGGGPTVSGILETAAPPLGLKVEEEEGF